VAYPYDFVPMCDPKILLDAYIIWERMGFPPIMDNFIEKVYHRNRRDEAQLLGMQRVIDYLKGRKA